MQYTYEEPEDESPESAADHLPPDQEEESAAVTDSMPINDDIQDHHQHHHLPLGMAILTLLGTHKIFQ
jgi:hypothetical protein